MKKRIVGSIIVMLIAIPMYLIGGYFFKVLSTLIGVIAYKELVIVNKYPKLPTIIGLLALLNMIIFNNYLSYILLCFLIIFILFVKDFDSSNAFELMGIILLLGISFNSFNTYMLIDKHILLYLVIITVSNDTFAYLTGSLIGKHKFSKISPNKTIEGLIGGIVFGVAFGLLYYLKVINPNINIIYIVLVTIILNLSAIFGDFIFSKIKREHKIKDYGKVIPGHGGILDRLDSLIITSIIYLIITTI